MSDFYRRRRVVIKDATALFTFFLGFVWSGAFAWPFLMDQADQGDITRGLAYFLSAVLGTAILTGALGLETGNFLGGLWERYHKRTRALGSYGGQHALQPLPGSSRLADVRGLRPVQVLAASVAGLRAERRMDGPAVANAERRPPPDVYYSESGVFAASFVPLAERVRPARYETRRMREALARTTNIGAWDGARLVGAVRIASDGYRFSAIADLMVDPEYQGQGIGRTLMKQALAATPDGRLLIDAQPECVAFFQKIGCDRGLTGFVMTPPALQ